MKIENWVLLFFALAIVLFFPFYYHANMTRRAEYATERYNEYITTAGQDAMLSASGNIKDSLLFKEKTQRDFTVKTFYRTLNACMGYDNPMEEYLTQYYVPCMVMVDFDGFYVEYPVEYYDESGTLCVKKVVTNINAWTKQYGSYIVRFYLNNMVKVTKANGENYYEGTYKELYADADDYTKSTLSFMADKDSFLTERSNIISLTLNDVLTEYINLHNTSTMNRYNIKYRFFLPESFYSGARNVTAPCIIAFLQGVQEQADVDYINIYSIAGNELVKSKTYYGHTEADGTKMYHEDGCSLLTDKDEGWGSMSSMAEQGYYPCPDCVIGN